MAGEMKGRHLWTLVDMPSYPCWPYGAYLHMRDCLYHLAINSRVCFPHGLCCTSFVFTHTSATPGSSWLAHMSTKILRTCCWFKFNEGSLVKTGMWFYLISKVHNTARWFCKIFLCGKLLRKSLTHVNIIVYNALFMPTVHVMHLIFIRLFK